jgi:hypothetical protein
MVIDSSSFGRIVIDGRTYRSDVVVYPDGRIEDNWWRASGHRLTPGDIADLIAAAPDILIAGTGVYARMVPAPQLAPLLSARGIDFTALPTAAAVAAFNEQPVHLKVGACFHLTC